MKRIQFPDETKLDRIMNPARLQFGHEYLIFDGHVGKYYRAVYYSFREYPNGRGRWTDEEIDNYEQDKIGCFFEAHEFLVFCSPQRKATNDLSTSKMICNALEKRNTKLVKSHLEKIKKKDSQVEIMSGTQRGEFHIFSYKDASSYDDILDKYPYKAKRIIVRENHSLLNAEFYQDDPVRIYEPQTPKILEKRENRTLKRVWKEKTIPESLRKTVRAFLNPVSMSRKRSRSPEKLNEEDIEKIRKYFRSLQYKEKEDKVFTENEINKIIVELNKNPFFVMENDKMTEIKYWVDYAYEGVDDEHLKEYIESKIKNISNPSI